MMDVLTSETCWAVNWHNKASVIKLVYLYSNSCINIMLVSVRVQSTLMRIYFALCMGADKSLARSGRKEANVSVRMAWISFGALPCSGCVCVCVCVWGGGGGGNLMTASVSMLLKSRASLICFRACFLPGRAKDLSALRYCVRIPAVHAGYARFAYRVYRRISLGCCWSPKSTAYWIAYRLHRQRGDIWAVFICFHADPRAVI